MFEGGVEDCKASVVRAVASPFSFLSFVAATVFSFLVVPAWVGLL